MRNGKEGDWGFGEESPLGGFKKLYWQDVLAIYAGEIGGSRTLFLTMTAIALR
ncbi:MAG: hypothetical protein ACLUOI_35935 [Eisenbergiella sp.]